MAKRLTKEELLLRTPPGLTDALSDFTTAVLRSQPDNIIKFAKEYFNRKYAETYDDSEESGMSPSKVSSMPFSQVPWGSVQRKTAPLPRHSSTTNPHTWGLGVVGKQAAAKWATAKLQAKFVGPYQVITAWPNHTYVVKRQGQTSTQKAKYERGQEGSALTKKLPTNSPGLVIVLHKYIEPEQEPPLAAYRGSQRRKSVAAEKYDPSKDEDDDTPVFQKDESQTRRLSVSVYSIIMFKALAPEQVLQLVKAMQKREVAAGEVIIKEGDEEAEYFYVIESGTYEIEIGGKLVNTYEDTGSFGELALLYNTPRAATITAKTAGELWALDRQTFRRIVLKSTFQKRQEYEKFINDVSILSSLEVTERMKVCDALRSVSFSDEEVIVKTGDKADTMYFVEEGEVKVIRTNEAGQSKEVSRITAGGYFGELGLISKEPRAADVVSVGESRCAELDVGAFERLLGPCVEVMKRNVANYEEDMRRAFNENKA
ncbi:cAMP-dependent protein kinase type II regulatory subunit-like [Watersipora subatra]|uniref:cAMP-dependent protein kinase type II regulatory subunit-like n=1 Tax=Watersipora subatra TaxID=2589382 RepID=UPI00355BC066